MTATTKSIEIHEIAYHRNGIAGEPFYAVAFTDHSNDGRKFLATVFPPDQLADGPMAGEPDWTESEGFHNPRIAVLALDVLPCITFGINSWRGDNYQRSLYAAILEYRDA